jgi:hypothetical protein
MNKQHLPPHPSPATRDDLRIAWEKVQPLIENELDNGVLTDAEYGGSGEMCEAWDTVVLAVSLLVRGHEAVSRDD